MVQHLVESCHANGDAVDYGGNTPLHHAALLSSLDVLVYLVESCRVNVEATNQKGETALHCTVPRVPFLTREETIGCTVLTYLVETCCVNLEATDHFGETVLHHAVRNNDVSMVQYLVTAGSNVEATDMYGSRPLHMAVDRLGLVSLDLVKLLVETHSADIEAVTTRGMTPLLLAVEYNQLNAVQYLMEDCGANVLAMNGSGRSVWDLSHYYYRTPSQRSPSALKPKKHRKSMVQRG